MMPTPYLVFERKENDTDPPYLLYFFDLSAFPECLPFIFRHCIIWCHSWFISLCVTICTVSLNDCKASHQSLTIWPRKPGAHIITSPYIYQHGFEVGLCTSTWWSPSQVDGKHCYGNQRWLSSTISELASQLAYDSCEKPVTKALLYPPDDRSDAWSCDSTLSTDHLPLKSGQGRDPDWAPGPRISFPSDYETKDHPELAGPNSNIGRKIYWSLPVLFL
jgi:hypothetical protein